MHICRKYRTILPFYLLLQITEFKSIMQEPNYNYLDLLNPQQRAAVEYSDGPSLVIAGAGSGKTRVLTYKIVDLISHGYEPYRILALTFTNKAAREMKDRIAGVAGEKVASRLWMGTFHSVFLRILRKHAELLGYKSNFTIYDTSDSKSVVKTIVRDLGLDEKIYKPATLAGIISNAKNALISAEQYARDPDFRNADRRANRPLTAEIFRRYTERCHMADAMDFDDILFNMNLLLRDHDEIRRHYSEFFRYILVDEYQDTNFAQHLIISQLAGNNPRLCVVGDDAQSIYSFRGANIDNILNLEKRYPGLRTFKLERNYRSTQNIVDAAGSLIRKNRNQLPKNVYSENDRGDLIEVVKAYSDLEEGALVAAKLSQIKLSGHDSYDDFAILYRTNAQSRVLEESLRKRNIPYRIYGGLSFYQRKEVKDAISYFRMSVNPDDDEALRRIINYPARGIGDTTMKKVQTVAMEKGVSLWAVISNPQSYSLSINSGTALKLSRFTEMIRGFQSSVANGETALETANLIYKTTGILNVLLHDNAPESISKQENLKEILTGVNDFVEMRREEGIEDIGMSAFLSEVSLATDQDVREETDEPKVTLMTAHAAKGLEFEHIFIVGVEEDLFPSSMSLDSLTQIEEERRLLYVAITRAKKTCTMSYATSRFRNGQTMATRPSRFLADIDRRYLNDKSAEMIGGFSSGFINPRTSKYVSDSSQKSLWKGSREVSRENRCDTSKMKPVASTGAKVSPQTVSHLQPGTRLRHAKFGLGVVERLDSALDDAVVVVNFETFGVKKLLVKFAKFEILK